MAKNLGSGKYYLTKWCSQFGYTIKSRYGMIAFSILLLSHLIVAFIL